MIHYRTLHAGDIDDIYAIELECFTVLWSRNGLTRDIVENPCAVYIGAFEDDELVGYGAMWVIIDEAHITNIAVKERLRGQGIGRFLLRGLIGIAKRNGAAGITLEVRPSNTAAVGLYESEGFVQKGLRKKYYTDNGEDAYIMWLRPLPDIAQVVHNGL